MGGTRGSGLGGQGRGEGDEARRGGRDDRGERRKTKMGRGKVSGGVERNHEKAGKKEVREGLGRVGVGGGGGGRVERKRVQGKKERK